MNDVAAPVESDHDEIDNNASTNATFYSVIQSRLSRRDVLSGTAGAAAIVMLGGLKTETALADHSDFNDDFFKHRGPRLGFAAVPKSLEDTVTVPRRYSYDVLYALGDPIAKGVPDYHNDGTDEAASYAHRAGDHHDAIQYFGLGSNGKYSPHSSDRGLLCMNHEAITPAFLHPTGPTIVGGARTVPDEVLKEFYVHGVSIIEIEKKKDRKRGSWSAAYDFFRHSRRTQWDYEQSSPFNRRIHTLTEIKLSGPAARTPFMVTSFRPTVRRHAARSTIARTARPRGERT